MRKHHAVTTLKPKHDYHDVRHAWFDYQGQSYAVVTAPDSVFKAAVLEKAPHWLFHAEYSDLLRKDSFDMIDRWYLLNCLADKDKGLELHARFEQVG